MATTARLGTARQADSVAAAIKVRRNPASEALIPVAAATVHFPLADF